MTTSNFFDVMHCVLGDGKITFNERRLSSISFRLCQLSAAYLIFIILSRFSPFLLTQLLIDKENLPFNDLDQVFQQTEYSICANIHGQTFQIMHARYGNQSGILNSNKCPEPPEVHPKPICFYDSFVTIQNVHLELQNLELEPNCAKFPISI